MNYLCHMYPAEIEIKETTESNTSASYFVYLCRSGGTVSCALPFTTNVTISTSISKTFLSLVAIVHRRQLMQFISQLIRYARICSSNEYFIMRAARLSFKLHGQWYVGERLTSSLGKFYGRSGDIIKYYEVSLSQILHDILRHDHIQWNHLLIRHFNKSWPFYKTWPCYCLCRYYLILGGFHGTFATGVASRQRTLTPQNPGPVPFVFMLRPFIPEHGMSLDLLKFEHPSVLLFCFASFVYLHANEYNICKFYTLPSEYLNCIKMQHKDQILRDLKTHQILPSV